LSPLNSIRAQNRNFSIIQIAVTAVDLPFPGLSDIFLARPGS
jgi:hypothetical protein